MKTITTTVYEFDELSDDAKEKAREWYRAGALDYDWWDAVYEDARQAGIEIKSFDLDRSRHACGRFISDAESVAESIAKNHGENCETYKTACRFKKDLADLDEKSDEYEDNREQLESEFLKSILEDYSILLQKEYEWLLSDEQVDESIKANEYTFTEDGKRMG